MGATELQSNWPEMRKTLEKPGFHSGEGGIRSKPPPVSLENRIFFNINPYFVEVLKTRGTWLVVGELAPLFG
jgi:hypothetical protein